MVVAQLVVARPECEHEGPWPSRLCPSVDHSPSARDSFPTARRSERMANPFFLLGIGVVEAPGTALQSTHDVGMLPGAPVSGDSVPGGGWAR